MQGWLRALCVVAAIAASPAVAGEAVPGAVQIAALTPERSFSVPSIGLAQGEPFHARFSPTERSAIVAKWNAAMEAIRRDRGILDACRGDGDACGGAADAFLSIAAEASARDGRARIGMINRAVNLAIRPADDAARFGMPDRWTSPLETLAEMRGDCEDYALLKYALLREAGFADTDLRLVIVRLPVMRVDHAVLAVRHEGGWLILDNRRFAMLDAGHFADEALFVLRGDDGADAPQMQADAGAGSGALPLVL